MKYPWINSRGKLLNIKRLVFIIGQINFIFIEISWSDEEDLDQTKCINS